MFKRPTVRFAVAALILAFMAETALAASCVNRFVSRTERPRQVVTLLTGMLTFQEAQELAGAIKAGQSPPLEWIQENGTTVARQFGDLKVVRPMPVGCEGKRSGVVIIVQFPTGVAPSKKMIVKLDGKTTVAFDQQAD
ncbi:MAG TPA: hypothetical protein VF701_15940 [Thermoanaerobaculia bacterium]